MCGGLPGNGETSASKAISASDTQSVSGQTVLWQHSLMVCAAAVLSFICGRELTNTNDLMSKLDLKDFNNLIVLMQKTVEGAISSFKMDRLQTTGTTCENAQNPVWVGLIIII
jgi:hypothetical protein